MFNEENHVFDISEDLLEALLNPLLIFFNDLPCYSLTNVPQFHGAGVYALYLTSAEQTFYEGCVSPDYPIYIGKGVPAGSRQGKSTKENAAIRTRLNKHKRSIKQCRNLEEQQFMFKFVILKGEATNFISAMESYFIRHFNPIWNSYIDGFGNNDPGKGRYNQSPSEWDVLHPGRNFAKNLTGTPPILDDIISKIAHFSQKQSHEG